MSPEWRRGSLSEARAGFEGRGGFGVVLCLDRGSGNLAGSVPEAGVLRGDTGTAREERRREDYCMIFMVNVNMNFHFLICKYLE